MSQTPHNQPRTTPRQSNEEGQQDWGALTALALVGTGRQTTLPTLSSGSIAPFLQQVDRSDPEGWLLNSAAILMAYRQAGKLLAAQNIVLPELIHPSSGSQNLGAVKSNHGSEQCYLASLEFGTLLFEQDFQGAIPEFLTLLQMVDQTIPFELLPQFLSWGQRSPNCNTSLRAVLGERGHWLAQLNPDWDYVQKQTIGSGRNSDLNLNDLRPPNDVSPEAHSEIHSIDLPVWQQQWQTGSRSTRIALLHYWRTIDPTAARDLLAQTWKQEKAAVRAEFLSQLQTGLSELDIPFLNLALTDRSHEVKTAAVRLLTQFPEVELSQQIRTILREFVQWRRVGNQLEVTIKLPKVDDPRWMTYGFLSAIPKQASAGQRANILGQLISLTPLCFWAEVGTPTELITALQDHNHSEMIILKWAGVNQQQPDSDWTKALLQWYKTVNLDDGNSTILYSLLQPLPLEQRQQWLIDWLKPEHWQSQDLHLLLELFPKPLSLSLSQALLNTAQAYLNSTQTAQKSVRANARWRLSQHFVPMAFDLDPEVFASFSSEDIAQLDQTHQVQIFSTIAQVLQFRQRMRQAILGANAGKTDPHP